MVGAYVYDVFAAQSGCFAGGGFGSEERSSELVRIEGIAETAADGGDL